MTLDEQVSKEGDAWAKSKSGSLFDKFGRLLAYAGLAASVFTGVSYTCGAKWAQDFRASFDVDYAHWINCERLVESDYDRLAKLGASRLEPVGIDLRLALARFIFDSELPKRGGYIASSRAYYVSRTFSSTVSSRLDVSGEGISDSDVLIELYKSFDVYFSDGSPTAGRFLIDLDYALASHSWAEAAKLLKVK